MKRPSIALCLIAKNEESNLARLLESVEGCFDEIHVTDTGSTDGTVRVAQAMGAIVHHFAWCDDFSAARNYSFSHTRCDYICWLDCDDVLNGKENFIKWRDTAMETANYWLVNYHYSLDANFNPTCSFLRERVVKNIPEHRWKYFIHEGIIAVPGVTHNSFVFSWDVKHMRTDEDMKKDRSRNIRIFEEKMEAGLVLDARLKFYHAKELFEYQSPREAVKWFYKALDDKDLEMHDRILAYQYLVYSLNHIDDLKRKMGNNDGEDLYQVINLAQKASILAPHRAEFYCCMGDAYIKLGRIVDAIPCFGAAKSCINQNQNGIGAAGAIFTFADAYSVYPSNQIARIYFQMSQIDKAVNELNSIIHLNNPETLALMTELTKLKDLDFNKTNPVKNEDIVITCPPHGLYEWDGKIYREKGIGGSETAAVEVAENFAKLGKTVKVFQPRKEELNFNGVQYIPTSKLNEYMAKNEPKAHIAWRHNIKVTNAPTYAWSHDLIIPGMENHQVYEKLLVLSPFQKQYAQSLYNMIPEEKFLVTRNGLNPEKFKAQEGIEKIPGKVIFSSSPDRGLKEAMLILDEVRKEIPEVTLHVFYGFDNLLKGGRHDQVNKLKKMIEERPYVTYYGNTNQKELMRHFAESVAWVYPADWYETYCITLFEAIASGCYPILRPVGSLRDFAPKFEEKGMMSTVDMDLSSPEFISVMADKTLSALKEEKWKNVKLEVSDYSWESLAKEWLKEFGAE